MQTVLTIFEETPGAAMQSIAQAPREADALELRIDRFNNCAVSGVDLGRFRALSDKPMILTRRSGDTPCAPMDEPLIRRAIEAGFDFVDVEYAGDVDPSVLERYRKHVILSHHDFKAVPDLGILISSMNRFECARVKIAVTPTCFGDNVRILEALTSGAGPPDIGMSGPNADGSEVPVNQLTLFGMGSSGLYSRILAPMFGSQMHFVARNAEKVAAPGQLTFERSLAILGNEPVSWPEAIFAVAGDRVAASSSPIIHNALFRQRQLSAAYSIIESHDFDEVMKHFMSSGRFAPSGLSVTAPFKEAAFRFAMERGATIGPNARLARAVNTLARSFEPGGTSDRPTSDGASVIADNTDVDGFVDLLRRITPAMPDHAAVIGSGGTARSAIVAFQKVGVVSSLFGRSRERVAEVAEEFDVQPHSIAEISGFEGGVVINTVPASEDLELPSALFHASNVLIDVSYGMESSAIGRARAAGMTVFTGLHLLEAQAVRQSQIFLSVIEGLKNGMPSKSALNGLPTGRMSR